MSRSTTPADGPRYQAAVGSRLGRFVLESDDDALVAVYLPGEAAAPRGPGSRRRPAVLEHAREEFEEYLAGDRRTFTVPLRLATGTPFQHRVWRALGEIPYATTISYADLAGRVGRPRAFRAVGQANGANPLPVVLPCHRVLASGGAIGGYGGGLALKRGLLGLEGVAVP